MLYTIISMDEIMFDPNQKPVEYKKIKNGFLDVTNGVVNSVFSTDPMDYLKINIGDVIKK